MNLSQRCLCLFLFLCAACGPKKENQAGEPLLYLADDLEATLWAESPMFYNPTNIDIDIRGRIWLTEAVNYRGFANDTNARLHHSAGDRVMILEDTDEDGKADTSKLFVQDKDLVSPLGIAVIGNKVIVSCSPSVIIYTDEDGDDKPDSKETFLTGFGGRDHDHGLHAGLAGPDGKLYFNTGNAGPHVVTDKSGRTIRAGSIYTGGSPYNTDNTPALKSDDGKIWTGGFAFRINPDGTEMEVLGHNFRNSYEVFVDSYGNLWQNDNDDEVASCRVSWLMEGSNAGFFSRTGERSWRADRRPGQTIQTAHWHQEDPGVLPAGDITGPGSPTGVVLNESDALGTQYRGLLLSADAGRNVIFGYKPQPEGAGYSLGERMNFISSLDDDNENYVWNDVDDNDKKWFRPSDVAIGTDGAIYVADWHDPIVGGHQMYDEKGYGRIYRIAPKNKELRRPEIDLNSTEGQIQAFLSPAVNVRALGFERLRQQGEAVLPEVLELLADENPYCRARATWLISRLGEAGLRKTEGLLDDADPHIRITAFRALRQAAPANTLRYAEKLARDKSAAVRREAVIALKDFSLEESKPVLLALIEGYDGKDPWYLNALGIALEGKEEAVYPELLKHFSAEDPLRWPEPLVRLVWELHPTSAVEDLRKRAMSEELSPGAREQALTALAFIPAQAAANAVRQMEKDVPAGLEKQAQWWLQFRKTNQWKDYLADWELPPGLLPEARPEMPGLRKRVSDTTLQFQERLEAALKLAGDKTGKLHLIDLIARKSLPDTLVGELRPQLLDERDRHLKALIARHVEPEDTLSYKIESISGLNADAVQGRYLFNQHCLSCHKMGEAGNEIGPELTYIHTKYDKLGILEAIVHPESGVAFGSEPYLITLKNGAALYGLLLSDGPVVTLMDTYGQQYLMEAGQIESRQRTRSTIMPPPGILQLSEKDVADISAYLLQQDKGMAGKGTL